MASAQVRPYIAYVAGIATLERDGQRQPAVLNTPIVTGDRIRTEIGRVDVLFPDGAALVIDRYSEVEFTTPYRVRVMAGTIEHRPADRYGARQYNAPYGYVWYPAAPLAWRPYHYRRSTGDHRATHRYRPPTPDYRATHQYQPPAATPTPPATERSVNPVSPPSGRTVIVLPAAGGLRPGLLIPGPPLVPGP